MVVIEMRDAAYETAFDLLDEAKLNAKKTKLTLCELENAMYDCYETSKEEHGNEDSDMDFRGVTGYREEYDRDDEHGKREDEEREEIKRRLAHRRRSRLRLSRHLV